MRKIHIEVHEDGTRPYLYTIRDADGEVIRGVQALMIGVYSDIGTPFTVDMLMADGKIEAALLGSLRGALPNV